jgi:hypothetical protein
MSVGLSRLEGGPDLIYGFCIVRRERRGMDEAVW